MPPLTISKISTSSHSIDMPHFRVSSYSIHPLHSTTYIPSDSSLAYFLMQCLDQDFPFNHFDLCSAHTMGIRQSILKGHFWLTNFYKLRFILKSNVYLLSIISLRSDLDNRKCHQTDGWAGLPYFKHQRYQILVKLFHNPRIVCTVRSVQSPNTCVQTTCIDCQRHNGRKALRL